MTKKLEWIALLIAAGIAGTFILFACLLFVVFAGPCDPPAEIVHVDVGNSRLVKFYGDSCWEGSRKVYYEAYEAGQIVVSRTLIDYFLPENLPTEYSLQTVSANDGAVVGLYGPKHDYFDEMFVIIDFRTREAWHTGTNSQNKATGLEMFQRLKQANPDLPEPIDLSR
jgi:hypothetical protein